LESAAVIALAVSCGGSSSTRLRWSDDDAGWMPDGRSIVFVSNRRATPAAWGTDGGPWGLYVMAVDGRKLRRLTAPGGGCDDRDPAPSPDGLEIAFLRDCGSTGNLMVVSSEGGLPRLLARGPDLFSWSPDGRLIAFTRTRDASDPFSPDDLFVVPTSGGSVRLAAKGDGTTALGSSVGGFAWSHDGTRIAFGCQGGSLCVDKMRTGTIRRLHLFSRGNDVSSVEWSPDDNELAFVDGSGGSYDPNYSAWVMAADGHHTLALPRHGEGNVDALEWLPNHPQVLLINTDYAKAYLIRADGTSKHDLPFEVDTISPSTDGSKLLFVRRVFDSEGSYYRSAISVATLRTGQTERLTQRP
jgi:Tol biopolymer transport system component